MSKTKGITLQQRRTDETMIKPGELVDIQEASRLTLNDRRIYNLLLAHAWENIDRPMEHCIPKKDLRGSHHTNERVGESIERLMKTIVRVPIMRDGEPHTMRVALLGANDEAHREDGLLYYELPAKLREVIRNSGVFARLRIDVLYALSSKYSVALYEIVQKRGNLKHKSAEIFDLDRFRDLLGVGKTDLQRFADLNKRAIKPAIEEVNGLSEFGCAIEPITEGRKVVAVKLTWWRKNSTEVSEVYGELNRAKVGRKARLAGKTEQIAPAALPAPPAPPSLPSPAPRLVAQNMTPRVSVRAIEKAKEIILGYRTGWDVYVIEAEFYEFAATKGQPDNLDGAFIGFVKKKAITPP